MKTENTILDSPTYFYFNNDMIVVYFNENRNDVDITSSYPADKGEEYITKSIIVPLTFSPLNYNFIKFHSKNDYNDELNGYYSWGDTGYSSKNINDAIPIKNMAPHMVNQKSLDNVPVAEIYNDTQTFMSAKLRVSTDIGFTYYFEKGTWYLQIVIRFFGQMYGSWSGGMIKTKLGNRFILSKRPID